MDIANLKAKAKATRRLIIEMLAEAGSGHPGGSLSCVEIITCLYFHIMRHRPEEPDWPDRDRFILSKGHSCPTLYSALALSGYFDLSHLKTLRKLGSILQGHPDMLTTPGIEVSTGSLGQGFSIAGGMALSARIDKKPSRIYVLLGDGEMQEGQVWEAAMSAAHYRLSNLTAFLDYNRLQIDGRVEDIMAVEPVRLKWESFGWDVAEIDGHNILEIIDACEKAKSSSKPSMIIANTIKGKGVSFMEGKVEWHGVAPTKEEAEKALLEIEI
ncbi:MAG: transketolase [bacterium]|nr:transketolase [bacterium]